MKLISRLSILAALVMCAGACVSKGNKSASANAVDPNAVVAKVGGTTITNKDVNEIAKGDLLKLEQQFQEQSYQVRRQAVDALVTKRLLEEKAKASKKSPEEYLKAELTDKIPDPTDEEIKSIYDNAKAAGKEVPPFDKVKDQIKGFLKQQKIQAATESFYDKLKAEAKVEILLPPYQPPRVEVAAKGPSRGPANAKVTIVEFSEYECPFCSKGENIIAEVLKAYPDTVRVVFRDYPLPMHANAPKAAEAAHCADDQGKFWEMHDKLFANQKALELANLKDYAKSLNLDMAKFETCLDSGQKTKIVAENQKAGSEVGVSGTPAFFINGMLLSGAQPFSAFKALIDAELAKK